MLNKITSAENSKVRLIRKLHSRKGRLEEQAFVAEGRNLVQEILEKSIKPRFIFISDECSADDILGKAIESEDISIYELPENLFSKITDAGHGIGVLAVVDIPEYEWPMQGGLAEDDNILVLDRLQDPGNMGTLVRTAVAAGYRAVIAARGTADVYSTKVLRATAGTLFEIPIIYAEDINDLRKMLESSDRRIVITEVDAGVPYYKEDISKGIALVIGNEGSGVSEELKNEADVKVTIPMKGQVESLNAAVAAAILMFESVRNQKEVSYGKE